MEKGLYLQGLEDYTNETILVVVQKNSNAQNTKEQDEEIHG